MEREGAYENWESAGYVSAKEEDNLEERRKGFSVQLTRSSPPASTSTAP